MLVDTPSTGDCEEQSGYLVGVIVQSMQIARDLDPNLRRNVFGLLGTQRSNKPQQLGIEDLPNGTESAAIAAPRQRDRVGI